MHRLVMKVTFGKEILINTQSVLMKMTTVNVYYFCCLSEYVIGGTLLHTKIYTRLPGYHLQGKQSIRLIIFVSIENG